LTHKKPFAKLDPSNKKSFPILSVPARKRMPMKPMWKSTLASLLLAGILSACSLIPLSEEGEVIPQAEPVLNWLKAAKNSDPDLLKNVFSERMVKTFKTNDKSWPELLNIYQKVFKDKFGEYDLNDFSFIFEGGSKKGNVIIFKETGSSGLPVYVIKEKKQWKVNER
jgi:hypothetical protein